MTANAALTRTVLDASDMKCRCASVVTKSGETTGCARTTTRTFAPGHDAKLKSLLGLALANDEMVTVTTDGVATEMSALEAAGLLGNFGYMVREIAAKITAKRDRAANHQAKLAANRAKREAEKAQKQAKKAAARVAIPAQKQKAKVGRWTYEGTVENGEFTYTNKQGETMRTAKFQLV